MRPRQLRELAEFERLRRRLTLAVAALLAVTVVGVVGFSVIGRDRHGLVDAIYMTVITLTTVGFGEIIDMSGNPAARVFTVFLLLFGMGIVAYSVPMLAAFAIEGHLFHFFARRRMEKTIAHLSGHYVVCGDTAAMAYVAQELMQTGRQVVLVAPSEAVLEQAGELLERLPSVTGDPGTDAVLTAAGVPRAAGVVISMENDRDTALAVLTARRQSPGARIVASTEHPENEDKLRTAGADAVVSPSRTGGLRMASELIRPKVVSFLDQMLRDERSSLRVEELTVAPGAPGVGGPLAAGMTLVIMADAEGRARLERRLLE